MQFVGYLVVAVVAYLLGSIPTGYLVAKAKGVDIRSIGSGNIGATNVFRALGKPAGVLVLLLDAAKGFVAVLAAVNFHPDLCNAFPAVFGAPEPTVEATRTYLGITAALFAVLGHNYTCWLRFRGGKGIATSAGVLGALVPWALLLILGVWIILFVATRYVSVGSIGASVVLPLATWFTTKHNLTLTCVTAGLAALAIYKHRANIHRLIQGTENRISFKRKGATS